LINAYLKKDDLLNLRVQDVEEQNIEIVKPAPKSE
jgi:hypothetical protein